MSDSTETQSCKKYTPPHSRSLVATKFTSEFGDGVNKYVGCLQHVALLGARVVMERGSDIRVPDRNPRFSTHDEGCRVLVIEMTIKDGGSPIWLFRTVSIHLFTALMVGEVSLCRLGASLCQEIGGGDTFPGTRDGTKCLKLR